MLARAVFAVNDQRGIALRGERGVGQHINHLGTCQAQRLPRIAALELQRQHAHAHQVGAVDALKAARHHGLDAQQLRALGGPVTAGAGAVFLAGKHHRGCLLCHVLHGRVEDEHLLAPQRPLVLEHRDAAFLARAIGRGCNHEVLDAHVGEGAAHHHIVVAAARAVAVEVGLLHTVLHQPLAGGRAGLDGASGRDMVGGDGIAKQRHDAGTLHCYLAVLACSAHPFCASSSFFESEIGKKWRLGNVGAGRPGVGGAGHPLDFFPQLARVGGDLGVVFAKGLALHGELHEPVNLVAARPDVAQVNVFAPLALAHGLGHQVPEHRAGNRISHHQRRTGQKVGLEVGVDARLEVAVAGQHGRAHQVIAGDDLIELGRQIARIANAGGAAVARQCKAQLFQVRQQAGFCEVFGHDARAGCERSLDVRLHPEPRLHGFLGQQASRQQHAGVAGVGAAGDGSNQHVAIAHRGVGALGRQRGRAGLFMRSGQRRLVGLHLGHKARRPHGGGLAIWRGANHHLIAAVDVKARVQQIGWAVEAVVGIGLAEQVGKLARHLAQLDAVLRALGASQAGGDLPQVELHDLRVIHLARQRHAKQPLGPEIGLECFDLTLGAARALEVLDGSLVHREKAHGGTIFWRHVADGGAIGQRQGARALAKKFDKLAHHLVLAQDFGHGEHQVSGGDAFAQLAGEFHAHHIGGQKIHRLAQHGGFGLDAAHAPAHHANAVDHGGVAVGAHQGVGVVHRECAGLRRRVALLALVHAARQVFEVDLVHDAKARRHHAKGVKGLHAPFHELVALAVALKFELHVQVERILLAVVIDHDGVVHHQVHGHQRLDLLGVLAQLGSHAAHGGQVGQQRHTGEVLQHHARNDKRDLILARGLGRPLGELLHMLGSHFAPIAIAQHRFEHDANRHGQSVDLWKLPGQRGQRIQLACFAGRSLETLQRGGKSVAGGLGRRGHGELR